MINAQTLRWLDRWIGVPACLVFTVVRRVVDLVSSAPETPPRSIVFIKLVEQGSTVLAYGAIRSAIEMVGRQNVYFLVFEENRFILDVMKLIDPANVLAIRTRGPTATIKDFIRTLARIRRAKLDAVIDLEFFARGSALLAWLSGCRVRVGFHAQGGEGPYRGDLLTHRLRYNPHLHTSQTFQLLVAALSAPAGWLLPFAVTPSSDQELPPPIVPSEDEFIDVSGIVQTAAPSGNCGSLVLLNPNCSDILPLRRWPVTHYVKLAQRLLLRYPQLHIGVTGAPAERAAAEEFVRQIGSERCFSLAGKTTLRQLLVLYCMAEVLVTNDSGPAHFATLTPIDVVTLFGPETPHLFAARSPRNHVFWRGLACSPCVSAFNQRLSTCQDNVCMQQISVETVYEKVCAIYDQRVTGPAKFPAPQIQERIARRLPAM